MESIQWQVGDINMHLYRITTPAVRYTYDLLYDECARQLWNVARPVMEDSQEYAVFKRALDRQRP